MAKIKKQLEAVDSFIYKPHITLTEDDLPEIKKWKVGETYTLVKVVMKQIESRLMNTEEGQGKKIEARFEIKEVKAK